MLAALIAATTALALIPQDSVKPADGAPRAKRRAEQAAEANPAQVFAQGDAIPKLRFERILPELPLVRPVQAIQQPGDAVNLFILEQPGRILVADPSKRDTKEAPVFLDIREPVNDGGNEEGLLSVAFAPDFEKTHKLYAYYTAAKPRR
jgi:hypothetical protein